MESIDVSLSIKNEIIPLAGCLAIIFVTLFCARLRRDYGSRNRIAHYAWALVFIFVQVAMGILLANGWMMVHRPQLMLVCGAATVFGVLAAILPWAQDVEGAADRRQRDAASDKDSIFSRNILLPLDLNVGRISPVARVVLTVILLLVAVLCCFVAAEIPWNYEFLSISFKTIELAAIFLGCVTLLLMFQGRGAGIAVAAVVCMVIGLGQYFVLRFKGTVVLPSDLTSLNTAASVAGGYDYIVDQGALYGILATASAMFAGMLIDFLHVPIQSARGRLYNYAAFGCSLCAFLAFTILPDYVDDFGVGVDYWNPRGAYTSQGVIPSFIAALDDAAIDMPDGYSESGATSLLASNVETYDSTMSDDSGVQEQFEDVQPAVVVIMNESFADLSVYEAMVEAGYDGPTYYNEEFSVSGLQHGVAYVSVNGGGTCDSEFEFLTGISMSNVGAGEYPYGSYGFSDVENLARLFSGYGYETTAIHPNLGTNWSRDKVYRQMGFDSFLTIDDFDETATSYHSGVSDRSVYDMVLSSLSEDDSPQFIFAVTMQNHGGYDQENIPEEDLTDYSIEGVDDAQLNEYIACINRSDEDLEYFVSQLQELDRPVVLVFFGDHQPSLGNDLNSLEDDGDEVVEHTQRVYQTVYTIWANYDVAGSDAGETSDTSLGYLGGQTLQLIGAPLSDYQKAQIVLRQEIVQDNLWGYLASDGTWYPSQYLAAAGDVVVPDEVSQAHNDLATIAYLKFGSVV